MHTRLYFSKLASELGISGGSMPPMDQKPPAASAAPMTHPNVWRKEGGEKLLAYLKANYKSGDVLEYDGHGDCWLMLAMMDQMRACKLCTYIGGPFDKVLPIVAYRTGSQETPGQPCSFSLEDQGDNVRITVHLRPEGGPFDMPFSDIVAPEIPAGKNIYVRLDGRHLLFTFPLALTYGETCRSLVMDYDGECFVSVSHTPALAVGDLVQNPFSDQE